MGTTRTNRPAGRVRGLGLRGGGFKRLIRNQGSLRSLILALGRFALVDTGVTMGLPPQALPEGVTPSDSLLCFAAV